MDSYSKTILGNRSSNIESFQNFSALKPWINSYMGSSTETVAFQVYEILKIDHEFFQFFWLESKI